MCNQFTSIYDKVKMFYLIKLLKNLIEKSMF